jgi:hypothetical protein
MRHALNWRRPRPAAIALSAFRLGYPFACGDTQEGEGAQRYQIAVLRPSALWRAPGPRDSWTEGTPHFHSACYEGALSGIGGWRANPRTQTTPGGGRSFPGSTARLTHRAPLPKPKARGSVCSFVSVSRSYAVSPPIRASATRPQGCARSQSPRLALSRAVVTSAGSSVPCSQRGCRCDVSTRTSFVSSPAPAACWPRTTASMRG